MTNCVGCSSRNGDSIIRYEISPNTVFPGDMEPSYMRLIGKSFDCSINTSGDMIPNSLLGYSSFCNQCFLRFVFLMRSFDGVKTEMASHDEAQAFMNLMELFFNYSVRYLLLVKIYRKYTFYYITY
jgi:hypothetical protein